MSPVHFDKYGNQHWKAEDSKPSSISFQKNTSEQIQGVINCTARMLHLVEKGVIAQEDFEVGIKTNSDKYGIPADILEAAGRTLLESAKASNSETQIVC